MLSIGAPVVTRGIRELFGKEKDSDCDVALCFKEAGDQDKAVDQDKAEDQDDEQQRKRPRLSVTAADGVTISEVLPGHLLVLKLASEPLRAQAERWNGAASQNPSQGAASSSSIRPELRVLLGSEAEVPFARAAIGYAYTGRVAADSVRAALEVRRQAAYLQIDGCAAACDELLLGMLAADSSAEGGGALGDQAGCAAPGGEPSPPALQFMACGALLPDPAQDPTFAPVLAAAKKALVRHFGDALAALNTPSPRQQLLQLPAIAVEALLGSDAFGTDSEDSVLLLLATWMKANHGQADAAARERLCRLVRLVQLGRPYLTAVLPALAADYETGAAGSPCAWFPVSVAEAGFLVIIATLPAGPEKEALLACANCLHDTQSPRYNHKPRPQCLLRAGRTFEWAISQQQLREAMGRLQPAGFATVSGVFAGGCLCARGFEWEAFFQVKTAEACARIFLRCVLPDAYDVPGSRLGSASKAVAVAGVDASFVVHSWSGDTRQEAFSGKLLAGPIYPVGRPVANRARGAVTAAVALSLAQPVADASNGEAQLAGWAAYLRGGCLTGTLTLLPPAGR